jgi:signal peptidase complex subunit 2
MQWFDVAGHFVALPFQQMFAGEVPVIGKADPMKAVAIGGKVVQTTPGSQGVQQSMDGIITGRGTGASVGEVGSAATPRKSAKSRKKA